MSQNIVEYLREQSIKSLHTMNSFKNSWANWREDIETILQISDETSTVATEDIINLGDKLSSIFKGTAVEGRDQSSLSGGGYAWEGLVAWYLNLCLIGTRAVVVKYKKEFIPEPIRTALTVYYGNFRSNTESDLLLLVFPARANYINPKSEISIPNIEIKEDRFNYKEIVDKLTEGDFRDFSVGVIQCKTNWNDNAQIPMLWNMVYSARDFRNAEIRVGETVYNLNRLNRFSYAFMTVPSNKHEYKSDSTAVLRVRQLSGGNYWGQESQEGVAQSIKEYIENNVSMDLDQALYDSIEENKEGLINGSYEYFFK